MRDSLEELLRHPLFSHSKRLPAFLRCVVLAKLDGADAATLKERTIGVTAFHRQPDYDTNLDPIVRITAGEVRKKLAQYYYAEGREAALRIELPAGAYSPRFRLAGQVSDPEAHEPASVLIPISLHKVDTPEIAPAPAAPVSVAEPRRQPYLTIVLATLLLLVAAFAVWRLLYRTPAEQFWQALGDGSRPVLIVLPTIPRTVPAPEAPAPLYRYEGLSTAVEDASVASAVTGELRAAHRQSSLGIANNLNLADLRSGPAVLVGALDNVWTMRSSSSLPFPFERSEDRRFGRIVNTLDLKRPFWSTDFAIPNVKITKDYGVVARYHDTLTDQPILLLAGISAQGTFAAGEAVTNPQYLKLFLDAGATAHKNFEAVIETQTVDGKSGPPRIVAFKTW